MNKIKFAFFFSVLFFLASSAFASNWYVRQSGGGGTGTSWSAAWNGVGSIVWSSIKPGDTIWMAGGSYGYFKIQASGTASQRLYIKRATAANVECTSSSGWQAAFDSQVVISGDYGIHFDTYGLGYVTIDGQVTNGIRVNFTDQGRGVSIRQKADYIYLFNLDIAGPAGDTHGGYAETGSSRGIDIYTWSGTTFDPTYGIWIRDCNIHGSSTLIYATNSQNIIVEKSNLYDSRVIGTTVHSNVFFIGGLNNGGSPCRNGIFRYNKVWNMDAEGVYFTYGNETGWKVYGNLFRDSVSYGRAIETDSRYLPHPQILIYNNTFVNLYWAVRLDGSPDTLVKNNIFYDISSSASFATHDYNWFYAAGTQSETHIQNGTGSPFINLAAGDYRLVSATNAGDSAVGAEYASDILGASRGADGVWDRGAYEFYAGQVNYTVTPSSEANGSISPTTPQTVSAGSTKQFLVSPSIGYTAAVGGTCGGVLVGTTYTTNPVYASCTVVASFSPMATYYTVFVSAGAGGAATPSAPQTVLSGTYQAVTTSANAGYVFTSLSLSGGCTGYSSVGNAHSVGPVTGNCTVTANFAATSVMDDGTAVHTLKPTGGGGKLGTGSGFVLK